ncbi:S-adenosyl-L-methionine-dependent methyltransferase [Penicillium malachiteum]|uniref:S-adenosyl-L-methionine-dependent methyltransferase n=1 Tax=Penicillium malachiteum TaxID=1324776 RepID=UPI002548A437|nr:S-adenosyl-L-methionine-dependent methyltransferase [Penicillium malachiteum]KAJ5726632.1 S-adenosyl-L-methionine-dependent methyltransferase [Penicillium malachiteum]
MESANIKPDERFQDGGDDVLNLKETRDAVTSEVTNYKYQNGRCYNIQPDGTEDEFAQVDMGQHVYGLLYKEKLFHSPTDSPSRVLDVGAGSGKWALDMGVMYPDATITGVDISDIQPPWTPENVKFDITDINKEWDFGEKFDLILVQGMAGMIKDWAYLSGQAMNTLISGGYLEIHDFLLETTSDDKTLSGDSKLNRFNSDLLQGFKRTEKEYCAYIRIQETLERAGFLDIQRNMFYVPTNTWPMDQETSELGEFRNLHYMEAIQGAIGFLTNLIGYTEKDAESFTESVQAEVNNRRIHTYDVVRVFTAKKPDNY